MDTEKKEQLQNPRANANFFEIFVYSWMFKLFKTGQKKELDEDDLYEILDNHKSVSLGNKFEKIWRGEINNAHKSNRKPSLVRALIKIFGGKYMLFGLIYAIDELILRISQPILLGKLLTYYQPNLSKGRITYSKYALIYASVQVFYLFSSRVLCSSVLTNVFYFGMKIRMSCCSTIFRKALRLSHSSLAKTTVGQILNILSNDVNRFDASMTHLHFLWIGPLQAVLIAYLMWLQIGVSSLFSIATLLLFIPLQGWFGKKLSELRSKTARKTDERVCLMIEIISGIQVIKMFSWEIYFKNLIEYVRKKEMQYNKESLYVRAISWSFKTIQTRFQSFLSILLYVLLGNKMSIQKIYVIITFFNLLEHTILFFGKGMEQLAALHVSVNRIQNFLLHEEKNYRSYTTKSKHVMTDGYQKDSKKYGTDELHGFDIFVSNVNAKWTNDYTVNTLENINLSIKHGDLVAIIGPVGSGKTSLLQAILGELPITQGRISVNGVVSYASQEPWLFAGTIQRNIIFDSPLDEERYTQVVRICALKNDFEHFSYGDKTIIGERGVTLSGGQKARINLARALYKKADVYLLDDPLSAVDTNVGKHLFEKCIKGYLKKKTCVLITHQIQYLAIVDQIVLMENANIIYNGSYQGLQKSGFDFTKLFKPMDLTMTNNYELHNNNNNINKKNIDNIFPSQFLQGFNEVVSPSINNNGNNKNPIQEAEIRSIGKVSLSNYTTYFTAGGNICKIFTFFFMFFFTQLLITGGDYCIVFWINREEHISDSLQNVTTDLNDSASFNMFWSTLDYPSNIRQICIIVYVCLIILMIISIVIRSIIFISICMKTSANLHNRMLNAIINATMFFFNTNSSGRLINRFSKDIKTIDDVLPFNISDCLVILMLFLENIFVVGIVNIYLIIPSFILGVIFYNLGVFCLPVCRSTKRLERITRSPIYSHMNACIQGLTTIRAYKAEKILSEEFDRYQDLHSSAWYLLVSSKRAFSFWLDMTSVVYISTIIFGFIIVGSSTYKGNVGLAITQTILMAGKIQWGIIQFTELENQMISVERVREYSIIPNETNVKSSLENIPPKGWPSNGEIVFQHFSLRYSLNSTYILKNFNIRIESMEKVGIVGRTGAGKSSILIALLRLAHNDGHIIIDGIRIHDLKMHDLRSKFSIIPQEPVLFSGTMRKNLDPFDEYPDYILWKALEEVELKIMVKSLPNGLKTKISQYGINFSIGQRQLICLARALVRNNKILILDEATANVDQQTDALIQNTIRDKFQNCTVLTIAHRLNTIINSDKVLVIDAGVAVEFDHPFNLLRNNNGFFYKMVEQLGQDTANTFYTAALKSFKTKKI